MTITNCLQGSEKPQDISDLALSRSLPPTKKKKKPPKPQACKYLLSSLSEMNQTTVFYPLTEH